MILIALACTPQPCGPGLGRADDGECSPLATGDSGQDTAEPVDPCPSPLELQVSSEVSDHSDATIQGSAAALMASVPEGCEAVLVFEAAQAWPILGDLDFPSWVTLSFSDGAWLDVVSEVRVDGGIQAGRARIFSDAGQVTGAPDIESAWPEWFGAVPDDDLDDRAGLQRAADFFAIVDLDAGVYDLADTVTLSSGARLQGPEGNEPTATLRSALVHPSTGGFHPTRMLQATGASDLVVRDLVLDGHRHAHLEEPWDYPETDNLARFEHVDGLLFERVLVTGWEANWGIDDQSYAAPTAVLSSTDIRWVDVSFTDSRTEGLLFQDCLDLSIERLSTRNTDVWTPLNVFYVTGFSLTDSTLIEDEGIAWSGSTANLTVSDARVSGNTFIGGWGVDFGDETGTSPFGPTGVTVEDNVIETVGAGIYFSPYADGDRVSDVVIRGNDLTLHRGEEASSTDVVVRLDACADVLVEDNVVEVPEAGEAMVQGISFRASTDGVLVQGNTLTGVDAGITHSGDTAEGGDLDIRDNVITCAEDIRVNSWTGGSTGVWIFRYVAAEFGTITVADNWIQAKGGWVSLIDYATLSSEPPPFVDALVVTGNTFEPTSGSERDVFAEAAASLTVTGNTPEWVNR